MADGRGYELIWGDLARIPHLPDALYGVIASPKHAQAKPAINAALVEAQVAVLPTVGSDLSRERVYALKALEQECEKVAYASQGNRNETLNNAAFAIGTLLPLGGITEGEAVDAVTDAALQVGLKRDEIQKTIQSGITSGKRKPRTSLAQQDVQLPLIEFERDWSKVETAIAANRAEVASASKNLPVPCAGASQAVSQAQSQAADEDGINLNGANQPTDGRHAIADARRKAWEGWPAEQITTMLTKRGEEEAAAVATNAVKWAAKLRPGNQIQTRDGPRRITSIEWINLEYVMLQQRGQSSCVVYIKDALPITVSDFRMRLGPQVVIAGVDPRGTPITKRQLITGLSILAGSSPLELSSKRAI